MNGSYATPQERIAAVATCVVLGMCRLMLVASFAAAFA